MNCVSPSRCDDYSINDVLWCESAATEVGYRRQDEDLMQVSEVVQEMLKKEREQYNKPSKYFVQVSHGHKPNWIQTEAWRRKICNWCFEVVDHFNFGRNAVAIALNFLDRAASLQCFSRSNPIDKNEYQLLAISSLYLAIKLHGEHDLVAGAVNSGRKLSISSFAELSRGLFQATEIKEGELRVVSALEWYLNPATPSQYIEYFLLPQLWASTGSVHNSDEVSTREQVVQQLYNTAHYLCELACFSLPLTTEADASIIACGALLCSVEVVSSADPTASELGERIVLFMEQIHPSFMRFGMEVQHVQQMLRQLSPAMFANLTFPHLISMDLSSDEEEDGGCSRRTHKQLSRTSRNSPTCVLDDSLLNAASKPRKRCRETDDSSSSMSIE